MITSIILAAGLARRMGKPKQLLTYQGKSLIGIVTENFLAAACGPVLVVTGAYHQAVQKKIDDLPVQVVFNPNFATGQGSSLALGAQTIAPISPGIKGIMVAMGDQPLIKPNLIKKLAHVYLKSPKLIVRPIYQGQPGHPVFFNPILLPHLTELTGDTGARSILKEYRHQLQLVPVSDPAVCFDIDDKQDVLVWQSALHPLNHD